MEKSNFWRWREHKSRHHRLHNPKPMESWGRPIYFSEPIDAMQFREWLRKTLGTGYTEHLEVSTGGTERDKGISKRVVERYESQALKPKKKFKRRIIHVSIFSLPAIIKDSLGSSCAMPR